MKNKVLSNTENLARKIGGNNYDDAERSRARAKRCTDDVMFPALYINYLLVIMVTNSTIAYTTHHSFTSASVYFSTSISSHKHQISSLQKLIQGDRSQKNKENPRHFLTFPVTASLVVAYFHYIPDHHSRNEVNNVLLSNSKFPRLLAISLTTVQNPTFPGSRGLPSPCFHYLH